MGLTHSSRFYRARHISVWPERSRAESTLILLVSSMNLTTKYRVEQTGDQRSDRLVNILSCALFESFQTMLAVQERLKWRGSNTLFSLVRELFVVILISKKSSLGHPFPLKLSFLWSLKPKQKTLDAPHGHRLPVIFGALLACDRCSLKVVLHHPLKY